MRTLMAVLGLVALLTLSGCGSIINGSSECIEITSEDGQVPVYVDGQSFTTPAKIKLDRSETHVVTIKGRTVEVDSEFSPWTLVNIPMLGILGGAIGIGVDAASGGMYNLEPDTLVYRNGQIVDKENGAALIGGEWVKQAEK